MKVGVIRVLTTSDSKLLNEHGRIMSEQFGIEVVSKCIPDQPHGVYNEQTTIEAIPKIIRLAENLVSKEAVDLVSISCAADPGVKECRESLSVPVIGAGSSGAHLASIYASKIGVIGITPRPPDSITKVLGDKLICYKAPRYVSKTTDLFREDFQINFLKACEDIVNTDATAILFACTGFSTLNLKSIVSKQFNIPVFDLVNSQATAALTLSNKQ